MRLPLVDRDRRGLGAVPGLRLHQPSGGHVDRALDRQLCMQLPSGQHSDVTVLEHAGGEDRRGEGG